MLTSILVLNLLLAMLGFYLAWQIWQWRQVLENAADVLFEAERATHEMLHEAPDSILAGQIGARQLRQSHRQLESQLRKVQKVLGFVAWISRFMRGKRNLLPLVKQLR